MRSLAGLWVAVATSLASAPALAARPDAAPTLSALAHRLDNGLTLLVDADPGHPLVHVELWYRGGAAADPPDRAGMAHLLAHVIDRGTRHVADRARDQQLLAAGATALAADPMFDYTRFAVTIPAGALERLLWLESSRMGFAFERSDPGSASRPTGLFPALMAILNDERGAMAQERAQRPPAEQLVAAARRVLHGPLSPYGRDPVGDAGLAAVTRPELRRAYDSGYDPRRAVLVISGGVARARAVTLVRRYFGPLATLSPAPLSAPAAADTPAGARTVELYGLAGPPRLLIAWPSAAAYADGEAALEVAAEWLNGGPQPRLARALAGVARRVAVRQVGLAGAGQFEIAVELAGAAVTPQPITGVDALLGELRAGRGDAVELAGARNRLRTRRLAELETPAGRAQRLARYQVLAGDADYLRRDLERLAAVDAKTLQLVVAARLRDDQRVVVTGGIKSAPPAAAAPGKATPAPAATAARPGARPAAASFRSTRDDARWQTPPALAPARTASKAARPLRPTRLRNGLGLWWLPAPDADTVRLDLVIRAGSGDDPPGVPGVARQLLLAAGGPVRGADAPLRALAELGASVETAVDSDSSRLSLLVARAQVERALPLWLGLLTPARIDEWAKRASQPAAGAPPGERRPATTPAGAPQAERELARLMFGDQHAYVRALEPGSTAVNAAAVRAFFDRHYQPGNATLVGTGPVAPAALARALERWSGGSARGAKAERAERQSKRARQRPTRGQAKAAAAVRPRIVLLDRPGARTTEIRIGHPAVARDSKDHAAVLVANELLGGRFGRLDRRLRLERPLALGLRTVADARRAGGLWVIEASFAAGDAWIGLQEILRALDGLASGEASLHEVGRARVVLARRLGARVAARVDRAAALADLAGAGQSPQALTALPRALEAVTAEDVRRVCRAYLSPERVTMVVTGDRTALEEPLRDVGEVEVRPAARGPGPATAALQ